MLSLPLIATLATAGVAVDRWFGEPRAAHPLVGFGRWAMRLEDALQHGPALAAQGAARVVAGGRAAGADRVVAGRVLPFFAACTVHVALLWFALGARSLRDHIAPIALALGRAISRKPALADRAHRVARNRPCR